MLHHHREFPQFLRDAAFVVQRSEIVRPSAISLDHFSSALLMVRFMMVRRSRTIINLFFYYLINGDLSYFRSPDHFHCSKPRERIIIPQPAIA